MKKISAVDFNLDFTLSCGQVFRWSKHHDGYWYGFIKRNPIKIKQTGNTLEYICSAKKSDVVDYFNLKLNYKNMIRSISKDALIKKAIKRFWGLRLLHQDPFECLMSYIFSSQNNIPRINKMVNELSARFGKKTEFEGRTLYAFPELASLSLCNKALVAECKLGFRDKFLYDAIARLTNKEIALKDIEKMNYEDAKKELIKIKGVGKKVADCVLLFSYNKYEAFPIDVWIERVMNKYYKGKTGSYFGKFAGYAQEFLYMHIRNK